MHGPWPIHYSDPATSERTRSRQLARAPAAPRRRGDLAVAIHEAWHLAAAGYFAFPVRSAAVRPLAHTDFTPPFPPEGLAAAFLECAELALLDVRAIVGVLGAQSLAEQRLLRQAGEAHDVRVIGAYRGAYLRLPSTYRDGANQRCLTPAWATIMDEARAAVWRLRQRPGAIDAVMHIAHQLVAVGQVDQAGWERVWRSPVARPLRVGVPTVTPDPEPPQGPRKYWVLGVGASKSGVCAQCQAIADESPDGVPEDAKGFPTGVPGDTILPPVHHSCKCTIAYEKDMEP